jgi:transposase
MMPKKLTLEPAILNLAARDVPQAAEPVAGRPKEALAEVKVALTGPFCRPAPQARQPVVRKMRIAALEPHLTAPQLKRKYLRCRHSQEKKRWHGLYLMAQGLVASAVAKQLGMSAQWISETVHRYNQGGVEGVKNRAKNQGSKTLSKEELVALDQAIESGKTHDERLWSATQVKR